MHLPPILALLLTLGFIVFLFRRDIREQRNVTGALWIPVLWLTIIGSRPVTEWLSIFGFHVGGSSLEDGSTIDSLVYGVLIISGLCVLVRRRIILAEVIRNNRWMTVFFVYCFLEVFMSDFPLVALKRWLKVLGHPILVLVVLTEPDPEEAVIRLIKRCAYIWIPISIMWIKWFPDLGRGFSEWTGEAENHGIGGNKNVLGLMLFISGAFFFWQLLKTWRAKKSKERRNELILIIAFLYMIGWLLNMAQSSTCMVSLSILIAMVLFLGLRWVNPRYIGLYLLAAILVITVAEEGFDVYANFLLLLGKDPTLTGRTEIWQDLLQINTDPIFGTGFESFWLGDRLKRMWAIWYWHPNEAHNAYLETYLNLGLVGLFFLVGWFVATYQKARRDLINRVDWGRFRLAYLLAVIFYAWTEAIFRGLDPVYFCFYLVAMDYPRPRSVEAGQTVEADSIEADGELASMVEQNPLEKLSWPVAV